MFFSFKTFQALIKYLAQAKKENETENIKIYIKWSFLLDLLSLLLMFVFGIVLKNLIISWMNWPTNITKYLMFYLALLIFYISKYITVCHQKQEKVS